MSSRFPSRFPLQQAEQPPVHRIGPLVDLAPKQPLMENDMRFPAIHRHPCERQTHPCKGKCCAASAMLPGRRLSERLFYHDGGK